ncbi:receptor-like protein EIX2 [Bidens hawaiensis]|uniref:receptor-like protein EIX2 n=1 Tax=Bidens hawaiensis TaxID=980011 RepID=UPI00404913B9
MVNQNIQWLSSLRMLNHLDMSGVDLSKSIDWLQVINTLPSLVKLRLSSCKLSHIHPHVRSLNLTSLSLLELSYNDFNGFMPPWIFGITSLVSLGLSGCDFIGIIPTSTYSFCNLTSIEALFLYDNDFMDSSFVLQKLSSSNLVMLDLCSCGVSSSLLDSLHNLTSLLWLDLSQNQLTETIPKSLEAHLGKLVSLKLLDGTGNNLTLRPLNAYWIPSFQIRYLHLNSWDLGPRVPLWLQSQWDLRVLDISNTHISSPISNSFWSSFPNIVYLDMSENPIQGMLTLLGIPTTLEVLDLSSNNFWGKLPSLSNVSFPKILDMSNNSFTGPLHHFLCSNDVQETNDLNLGNNHLSGFIPECWEKWLSLEFLNLENNNLSGEIPRTLGYVVHLQLLNMHGNKISGGLPTFLKTLSNLEILQLSRNKLVGSIPAWIGTKLTSLRILNLRSNNLNGNIPLELCYLVHVQILDLANNNLSGNIPRCFNNFSVLSGAETNSNVQFVFFGEYGGSTTASDSLVMKGREDIYEMFLGLVMLLDLSCNNFYGDIPSELTSLRELKSLNLSRNQLTGRIPGMIGDMKELMSLDLSLNKLNRELPRSLSSLSFLSSFNVSYNNLTGRVPTSTQLQSFNESSFFGNNLCGDPLANRCEKSEIPDTHEEEKDNRSHEKGLIVSIVLGFVTGFLIIVAPLIANKPWRTV